MLTDPELSSIVESKIETEVLARLSTKSQNGSPILGTLVTPSKQQNISDQIGEAEKVLSKCTTLVEQLKQQTMRRPPSSKTNLQFSPTPKQKKEDINVESNEESNESDEDLNWKLASKPNTAYMKNESQNFTKHRFHNLEPGVAVMKLSNHSWKYDTNFPDNLMSSNESFRKIPNAIMCIHTLYRSMVPDAKEEEQPVEMITTIAETHADVVTAETGLDYFMTKFPNMEKLDIDLSQPYNNAIAVFLLKGQVKRYHYVLVNAIQSLVLFMYHWDGKYFGRNVLGAALNRDYDEVIRLMEPYIVIHEKRPGNRPLLVFVGAWQIETEMRTDFP
eukprot:jgi/Psemu1/35858/gm1.35858_g